MFIHIVQPGETIWQIAQMYRVNPEELISLNGLAYLPYLITGQSLVIPTDTIFYTVQPGESIWQISQRFNVSVDQILAVNTIPDPLLPGFVLQIPLIPNQYGTIEVNGYILPSSDDTLKLLNNIGQFLTYISPFSYSVTSEGSLVPLNDSSIIQIANTLQISPLLVLTNYRNGNFDTELAHLILTNTKVQQVLISNLLSTLQQKGYYGVNIDFERIPPEDRQLYNDFLRRIVTALHAEKYVVSTALAPKTSDITTGAWHGAHDYQAHGEIVDFVILMTYDWGWAGGPPYAIAPIPNVKEVLDYAVSVIPHEKIMLGMPFYGYDWTLPYVSGGKWATMISYIEALQLAAQYGAMIQYDQRNQAPFFRYYDQQAKEHIVWFEDARSVKAKYALVNEYSLRGVSYWVLNLPFPQNWPVLDFLFQIQKLR